MFQTLYKGKISSINEEEKDENNNPTKAKVIPSTATDSVTGDLIIDKWIRGRMGNLKVGDEVIYAINEDGKGLIIKRNDGEWDGTINGSVHMVKGKDEIDNLTLDHGDITVTEGNETLVKGNLNLDEGNETLSKGNLELKSGNETLDNGNLTLMNGNIEIQNGKLIVHGDVEITGNMTLTGNLTTNGTITAAGSITGQAVTSQTSVNAATITSSGTITASGEISATDVKSTSTTTNSVKAELDAFKTEYASHTHTTPSGQSGPPVG